MSEEQAIETQAFTPEETQMMQDYEKAGASQEPPKEEKKTETEEKPEVKAEEKEEERPVKKGDLNKALTESRIEIKTLKQQLKLLNDFKQEFIAYRDANKQPAATFEDDPLTFNKDKINAIEKQTAEINERLLQQEFQAQLRQLENNFKTTAPDYDNALIYLKDFKQRELESIGLSPEVISQELKASAYNLTIAAIQAGKNPVEVIYNIAKSYGYKTPEAKTAPANKPPLETDLETIAKGQENAAKTLSNTGKTSKDSSVEALLEADDAEFDEMWDKVFKK